MYRNYFPIRDFHRTLQIGKLLLEFYDEFFQFILEEHN